MLFISDGSSQRRVRIAVNTPPSLGSVSASQSRNPTESGFVEPADKSGYSSGSLVSAPRSCWRCAGMGAPAADSTPAPATQKKTCLQNQRNAKQKTRGPSRILRDSELEIEQKKQTWKKKEVEFCASGSIQSLTLFLRLLIGHSRAVRAAFSLNETIEKLKTIKRNSRNEFFLSSSFECRAHPNGQRNVKGDGTISEHLIGDPKTHSKT